MKSPSRNWPDDTCRGYTLLELVVVVSLVSVLVAVALPSMGPSELERLELAASRVADAIRFARVESIRTGEVHAVEVYYDTEQVIVSQPDMTQDTPFPTSTPTNPASILTHPLTKQPYDIVLSDGYAMAGVDVLTRPFEYPTGDRRAVLFNAQGMPFFKGGGTLYRLDDGLVELALGNQRRSIRLAPLTGRATLE